MGDRRRAGRPGRTASATPGTPGMHGWGHGASVWGSALAIVRLARRCRRHRKAPKVPDTFDSLRFPSIPVDSEARPSCCWGKGSPGGAVRLRSAERRGHQGIGIRSSWRAETLERWDRFGPCRRAFRRGPGGSGRHSENSAAEYGPAVLNSWKSRSFLSLPVRVVAYSNNFDGECESRRSNPLNRRSPISRRL